MPSKLITVILLVGMLAGSTARADVYSCTAAKERAKTGVHPGNAVATTSDVAKKECRFSVNGASTGSPPLDRVFGAFNLVIGKSMTPRLATGDVTSLAYLLISASAETEPPGDLLGILRRRDKSLALCFEEFEKGVREKAWIDDDNLLCRAMGKERVLVRLRGADHGIEVASGTELLVVGVAHRGAHHFLFVPPDYRQGRPFP
jgi:hypothetical protein